MSSRLRALAAACAAAAVVSGAAATSASATATCAAQGLTVTPLQSNVFYIDVAQAYLGSYVGYRIANTSGSQKSGLWVRLESFTGSVVRPADGGSVTPALPLADLAGGAATPAYGYLKATAATAAAQGHDVVVYDGRPGSGATEVCRQTQTIAAVEDVIKAAANKVNGASLSTASATLGSTFDLTVSGETGTIGAGTAGDPGVVRFSPAVAASWPASAFRLVSVSHRLPASGGPLLDVLSRSGLNGWANTAYTVTYRFRVVGPTSTSTPVVPVQNIASGTQVKHTDPGTLGSLAPIPIVTSSATLAVAAGAAGPYTAGASVPLTATVTNTGGGSVALDEIALALPAGWSYQAGTAQQGATTIDDPYVSGTNLKLVGPFTIPANSTSTFTIVATAGAAGTSGTYSAIGNLAGGQIDATTSVTDDAPATTTLSVLGSPTANADSLNAAAGTSTDLDVLANDLLAGGTATLAVTSQPTNGTASVVGGRIRYTPTGGYTGPDSLTYQLTTAGGTSTATVTLTVAAAPSAPAPANLTSSDTGTAVHHRTVTVPSGGTVRWVRGLDRVTSVTRDGEGTYVVDEFTGAVTFTPQLGYAGTAAPLTFEVTDSFGQTGQATYTPTVLAPAGPTATALTSSGQGPTPQHRTAAIPAGGQVTLLAPLGAPATFVTVAGQGSYSLDPATGEITFTPVLGWAGTSTPVSYRITDAYGHSDAATYTPTVVAPPAPPASRQESSAPAGQPQTREIDVPEGGTLVLLDGGQPVGRIAIPAVGTYEIASSGTAITFTPLTGYAGSPPAVTYRVTDVYGQASDATYQPTVTASGQSDAGGAPDREPLVCVSQREMTIHFLVPRGRSLRRLRVAVSGAARRALPVGARSVRVDMRGRGQETVQVRITGVTRTGERLSATRTYRPCRARLVGPPLRTLRLRH